MTVREAIDFLKGEKYIGSDIYASDHDRIFAEAIDTVVKKLEKPFPTDEEIYNSGNEHYIFGKNDPIGSRHRSIYESRRESFILGAIWMRDLIQERSKK